MKALSKMAWLGIMVIVIASGLMLGSCHASVGVDQPHEQHHVHGDGCGHYYDGSNWR